MNYAPSRNNNILKTILTDAGAYRFGIADAEPINENAINVYCRWIRSGRHGEMQYLDRYNDVRIDPRLLLPGATSIICCAFAYTPPATPSPDPYIAAYALGDDYHDVLKKRLRFAAETIERKFGGNTRVCVDTAPLRERYWATRSGLGFIGRNQQLILPGAGSYFFLGEILTTFHFEPHAPNTKHCIECGACFRACPTGALNTDGSIDARRCISYLTIEHRGNFPDGTDLHGCIYGCDKCAQACPHNNIDEIPVIEELKPHTELLNLGIDDYLNITDNRFSEIFRRSAIKRTKAEGLRRNAKAIADKRK